MQFVIMIGAYLTVAAAAVSHFGWLSGLGIFAAVYLLTPWPVR